jgi:hypothetical protein
MSHILTLAKECDYYCGLSRDQNFSKLTAALSAGSSYRRSKGRTKAEKEEKLHREENWNSRPYGGGSATYLRIGLLDTHTLQFNVYIFLYYYLWSQGIL